MGATTRGKIVKEVERLSGQSMDDIIQGWVDGNQFLLTATRDLCSKMRVVSPEQQKKVHKAFLRYVKAYWPEAAERLLNHPAPVEYSRRIGEAYDIPPDVDVVCGYIVKHNILIREVVRQTFGQSCVPVFAWLYQAIRSRYGDAVLQQLCPSSPGSKNGSRSSHYVGGGDGYPMQVYSSVGVRVTTRIDR